jgi:muconate cycloisomerase
MRIAEITAMIVRLRLRKPFKHASFVRTESDNLIVRCRLVDGTVGWGEGVPRTYVTGESPAGAMQQIANSDLASQFSADCDDWPDVIELCERYRPAVDEDDPRGCLANSHRCAIELSILDAFGQLFETPLRELTGLFSPAAPVFQINERVQYSSAISSGGFRKELLSSLAMRIYGFQHCKVKVAMQPNHDATRLRRIRRWVGRKMDLRVDANEAWSTDEVTRRIQDLEPMGISCVEQPVRHDDVDVLAEVRTNIHTPIMLDESLTSLADAQQAIKKGTCDLFNIRLSKCGGLLNSLRLAATAHAAGLGYQLGCHPGESGILSAAGRHFATSVADIRYREGSADRHMIRDFITHQSLTFGRGGWAPAIDAPGLGITIDEATLAPLVTQSQTYMLC